MRTAAHPVPAASARPVIDRREPRLASAPPTLSVTVERGLLSSVLRSLSGAAEAAGAAVPFGALVLLPRGVAASVPRERSAIDSPLSEPCGHSKGSRGG